MTRTSIATIVLGVLGIGALCVNVGGQQQRPVQQPGTEAGGEETPPPFFSPPPPQTRLEAIAAQKQVLIIKGYTEVGEVRDDYGSRLRVAAVRFTDARKSSETGLVVSIEQPGNATSVVAYVDADEMDALSLVLDALAKLELGASLMTNVEGVYRTRGELEFTNHASEGSRLVTARATQVLLPSGQVLQAAATFRPARLAEIRQHIATAKETLDRPPGEPAPGEPAK